MTAIAGFTNKGMVWVGGDSAASDEYHVAIRSDKKVWIADVHNEKAVVGGAGSYRVNQLIRYGLVWPKPPAKSKGVEALNRYMVIDLIDSMRECLSSRGVLLRKNEVESHENDILVGFRGKLFVIVSDLQVECSRLPFQAVGSGGDVALGVLDVLRSSRKFSPRQKIVMALKAAERHTPYVRGPFEVLVA